MNEIKYKIVKFENKFLALFESLPYIIAESSERLTEKLAIKVLHDRYEKAKPVRDDSIKSAVAFRGRRCIGSVHNCR